MACMINDQLSQRSNLCASHTRKHICAFDIEPLHWTIFTLTFIRPYFLNYKYFFFHGSTHFTIRTWHQLKSCIRKWNSLSKTHVNDFAIEINRQTKIKMKALQVETMWKLLSQENQNVNTQFWLSYIWPWAHIRGKMNFKKKKKIIIWYLIAKGCFKFMSQPIKYLFKLNG